MTLKSFCPSSSSLVISATQLECDYCYYCMDMWLTVLLLFTLWFPSLGITTERPFVHHFGDSVYSTFHVGPYCVFQYTVHFMLAHTVFFSILYISYWPILCFSVYCTFHVGPYCVFQYTVHFILAHTVFFSILYISYWPILCF